MAFTNHKPSDRMSEKRGLKTMVKGGENLQLSFMLLWFASSAFAQSNTATFDTGGTSSSSEITLRRSSGSGVTHAVIEGSSLPSPTGYLEIDGAGPLPIGSQVSFKAQAPMLSGRIYAEVRAPSTAGVAFSNPNAVPSVLSFFFTDPDGRDIGFGTTTISPNGQIARFLDEPPFNAPAGLRSSMTFTSTAPVAAIAVLGYLNERGVFLMPQDPVLELPNAGHAIIPYFIAGSVAGGNTPGDVKTTDIVMLNTTDQPLSCFRISQTTILHSLGNHSMKVPRQLRSYCRIFRRVFKVM
jgi:hypothetical protein